MDTDDLDYDLPERAIAQTPAEPRDSARLLVDRGPGHPPDHRHVTDLPDLVGPGDVVVVNTTRVLPARLHLRKATGGVVEVLLLEAEAEAEADGDGRRWVGLVRPGRRVPPGTELVAGDDLTVVVGEDLGEGRRRIEVRTAGPWLDALERHGTVPLPPYVHAGLADPDRYQTVYADRPGSVAAPTAGLHLTPGVLDRIRARGARIEPVELVVGLGTFRPIAAERVADHHMHAERYRVPAATLAACREATRVVAVGTTSVRALESAARSGELEGRTELFLWGDARFELVDVLVTNFHLPRSSLLALVDAFVGPRWRDLYATARDAGYRFLSFGDAMVLRGGR
ncbi:MAG: tRNA preQ1(34) S-adenosylmethionine ribosyltransferase-isomerase QueA [Acidimicrobiia bacterium]